MRILKRSVILLAILLSYTLSVSFAFQYFFTTEQRQVTANLAIYSITVPDDYLTIQEAINNANDGDTIFVRKGTYYENLILNKSITLFGENRYETIIDGNWSGNTIDITVTSVGIDTFTIRHASRYGIHLGPDKTTIRNNLITNNSIAIGRWINEGVSSEDDTIEGNDIIGNGCGVYIYFAESCRILHNNISSTDPWSWNAIILYGPYSNTITGNNLYTGTMTFVTRAQYNTISENNFYAGGIDLGALDSHSNIIYHNNFFAGKVQVNTGLHQLDDGYPSGGNYWSDHNPPDIYSGPYQNETGSDKIGDTPYILDANNTDRYPLVYPFGYLPSPDFNNDRMIDIFDLVKIALAYGSVPGMSIWNPYADLNQDGIIDIFDLVAVAVNFGKEWTPP